MKLLCRYKVFVCSIIALFLFNLTACDNKYSVPSEIDSQSKNNSISVFLVTDKDEYSSDDDIICYSIKNNSENIFLRKKKILFWNIMELTVGKNILLKKTERVL